MKTNSYAKQNIFVCIAQILGWFTCIQVYHQTQSYLVRGLILIFFCLMMQGVFSFIHECIHQLAHNHKKLNTMLGILSSTIFGTSYTLYRINHLGHHVRNRTRAELAEYIFPDESKWKKIAIYYFAILGGIWWSSFIGSLILPFVPYRLVTWLNPPAKSMNSYNMSFAHFKKSDWNQLRLESLFGVLWWALFIYALNWNFLNLFLLYFAFAFSYSSLQWVYHLGSPIDVIEGAYNLSSPKPVRWLFLNFSYNLTHHRRPNLPWQQLHEESNPAEMQPLSYRYFRIFLPPKPISATEMGQVKN